MSAEPTRAEFERLARRVGELELQVDALLGARRQPLRSTQMPGGLATHAEAAAPPPRPDAAQAEPIVPPFVEPPALALPSPALALPSRSLELRLGTQVFNLVGVLALAVGASWFFKLAIEHGWIGPAARVVLGLLVGAGLVVWSERFRGKGYAAFSYTLKAVGAIVLYLVLWAGFQLYHLLPGWAALGAMVLVTAANGWMAWAQDAELLAAYALAGGLATPLLLSTGGDHETFLFTYLASLDVAVVLLLRGRRWTRLLPPALLGSAAYFAGWYLRFFTATTLDAQAGQTLAFAALFWTIFAVVSLGGWRRQQDASAIVSVTTPLGNASFFAAAGSAVLQATGHHALLAWWILALAAVYLGLERLQGTRLAATVHLALAVILLTIAIPLKASGHSLTTAWLVEGLVLFWAASRAADEVARTGEAEAETSTRALLGLSLAGYLLGLGSLGAHWALSLVWLNMQTSFFNADLGSLAVAVAALAGAAWVALQPRTPAPVRSFALMAAAIAGMLVALLPAWNDLDGPALHPAFANRGFADALVTLAILGAIALLMRRRSEPTGVVVTRIPQVLFHLVAILAVEREIGALFTTTSTLDVTGALERSLTISGFLMLYGGTLLAAGFWRRDPFTRWEALALLLFTIAKVFLYDIHGLSQGYRVASFLALGVVLLAVSFAYQKDRLGLRQPPVEGQ